jgi:hypothetical protein
VEGILGLGRSIFVDLSGLYQFRVRSSIQILSELLRLSEGDSLK